MNAQQLRNSILQEAIQGRLVPQDPNDEPASVLLERIREEKKRLFKEGKLKKKDLEEKPISENEIPFAIPDSWEWCRLASYLDVRDGTHDSPKYCSEGIPFVTSKNLDNGKIDFSSCKLISEKDHLKFSERSYVEDGDILFAMIGSIGNPVIVQKDREFSIKNVALFKRYSKFYTNIQYIYFYLLFIQNDLKNISSGGVQSFVGLKTFREWLFPLPPLAEQKRIVAKIEELLPKVEKYGKAQDELNKLNEELPERLKKSILQEAIEGRLVPQDPTDEPASVLLQKIREEKKRLVKEGKLKKKDLIETPISEDEIPFEIPDSWEWVRLKSIACKIVDGDHNPPRGLSCDSGYYMLSSKNIFNDKVVVSGDARFLSYEDWKKCNDRTGLKKGDVLLTTVATLGRSCVYEDNLPYCFQRSVSIIRTSIFNYFLKHCFDSPYYQSLIDEKATGTAQRGFYLNQLEESIIPIPPLAEQKRIVAKIEQLLGEIDKLKK